uniref:Uncharacterized protein n=1 Tax=Anopheles quadriannulatus TaxID=34691 RepID=A0A182XFP2_ANOQN
MLAVIDRAIELKRGFRLRDTQRLTILALLTNTKSTLAQVSTGEGKSLIVVATSIVKALFHSKVDIVTSSPVLAKRDSEVNKDIYELFGVSVHHNCSEDLEQRKEAYSNYQVVYGDLASFQRDYLLDRFYGKNILGDRDFSCVIVDEVDKNIRIEEQAFGRAARSGDKGSGRMILMVRGRKQFRRSKIIDLKKKRDKNELYRISEVKSYYEKHIVTEENCFNKFKNVYEKHREALDNADVPKEVKAILLESCLDQWAFWLDEHSSLMEELSHECDEKRTPPVLKTFLNKLQSFQSGECTESYLLSSLWEAAYYYRAYTVMKSAEIEQTKDGTSNETIEQFKKDLRAAMELFEAHHTAAVQAAGIVGKSKNMHVSYDDYKEQKERIAKLAGKEIDENKFLKECESTFKLPSKEQFWDLLDKQKVISDIQEYIF